MNPDSKLLIVGDGLNAVLKLYFTAQNTVFYGWDLLPMKTGGSKLARRRVYSAFWGRTALSF